MIQGKYEPFKGKTLLQAGMGSLAGSVFFGLIIAGVPSWSKTWFIASFVFGSVYIIFAFLSKLERTRASLWVKFAPGWMFTIYLLMLSMRSFSHLISNDLLGIIFPIISFILTGLAASMNVMEKLPGSTQGRIQAFARRLNTVALAFVSIAGVLGASFGMFMARTGQVHVVVFVMGTISYIIALGIAYPLFKQFLQERRENGNN